MLKQTVKLKLGKDVKSMSDFFQGLVNSGQLTAFSCEVDKEEQVKSGNKVLIVKTLGATLTQINELDAEESDSYFIRDTKAAALYFLKLKHEYSAFYDDEEDSQTEYNHCTLERLVANPNMTNVQRSWATGNYVSEELIVARLRISYDKDWYKTKVEHIDQGLEIEGTSDDLFEKVCKFVRGCKK